jgi:uncharacterized surface protein with fasciclin (FAS1) repeats
MFKRSHFVAAAAFVLPLSFATSALGQGPASYDARIGSGLAECVRTRIVKVDQDIVEVASGNPAFSTLVGALDAAGLVGALKGPGPFTVFAPTNAAFANIPGTVLQAIAGNLNTLQAVLTYHVAAGTFDPRFAFLAKEIKTLQGQTLFMKADARGPGVNQSEVDCQGIRATNGTIWVIDSVLLPQF